MTYLIHIPEDLLENIKEDKCSMRDMQTLLRIIKNGEPLGDYIKRSVAENKHIKENKQQEELQTESEE